MSDNAELMEHEQSTTNEAAHSFDDIESLIDIKSDEQAMKEVRASAADIESKTKEIVEGAEEEAAAEVLSGDNEADTAAEAEYKKLAAKFNDKEIEIAAEALFKHTVDGEEVDVPLQELLNNYSGKVVWDKRFQELSEERKTHTDEVRQIESYINEFSEKMKSNDVMGALTYFAEFSGMSPLEFKNQLRETLYPQYEQYSQMDESQRKFAAVQEENEYLKWRQESETKRFQEEQSHRELQSKAAAVQETHGLSNDDYTAAYEELKNSDFEGNLTPELVGDYCVQKRAYQKADELFKGIAPEFEATEKDYDGLAKIVTENPDFTDEDWREIFADSGISKAKKNRSKTVSEKVRKNENESTEKSVEKKSKSKMDEFYSFDDI